MKNSHQLVYIYIYIYIYKTHSQDGAPRGGTQVNIFTQIGGGADDALHPPDLSNQGYQAINANLPYGGKAPRGDLGSY